MFPSAELLLCVVFLSPRLFRIKTLAVSPLSLRPLEPKLCRGYVFGSHVFLVTRVYLQSMVFDRLFY